MTAFNKESAFEIPYLKEGAKWGFSVSFKPEGDKMPGYKYANKHPIIGIHEINRWEGSPRGYSPRMRPLNPRQKETGRYNAHIFLQPSDLPELVSMLAQICKMFEGEIEQDSMKRAEYEVGKRRDEVAATSSMVDLSEFGMPITNSAPTPDIEDVPDIPPPAARPEPAGDLVEDELYGSEFGGDRRQKNTRPAGGREPGDDEGEDLPPF